MSNANGQWTITVVDANVIKGFDLFSKSDLYVQLSAGGQVFKTKTTRNSDYPRWNETFSFPMNNYGSDIEIKVLDDDFFKDDTIAVAYIPFKQFPNNSGEEKEYSIPLAYKNKDIGILHLRMRNNNNQHLQSNYQSNINQGYINDNNINSGYNSTMLGGHSYPQSGNNNNLQGQQHYQQGYNNYPQHNLNNDAKIISQEYHEEHHVVAPTIPSSINQHEARRENDQLTTHHETVTTTTMPSTIPATAIIESNKMKKTKKSDKVHKHKHHHDSKVLLPEKHHHYQDGYTSSSSESSNEGEKRRAAEGKLGTHAYDAPLQNNEPYINNTVPPNHPNHYYPADTTILPNNTGITTNTIPTTSNNVHNYNNPNYDTTANNNHY